MHFVVCSTGTLGDFSPFLEIAARLRQRGHRVSMATVEPFRERVEARGLDFVQTVTRESHEATLARPELWNPATSFQTLAEGFIFPPIRPLLEWVQSQSGPLTLVADFCSGPAARLAQEVVGVGLISVWANPAALCSLVSPPVIAEAEYLQFLDADTRRTVVKTFYDAGSRLLAPPINEVREEWNLGPVAGPLDWAISPQGSLALFPEWFGERVADWPASLDFTGFVLPSGGPDLPVEVEEFLQAGDPPVVVTFGTGMQHAQREFEMAAAACRRLGLRMLAVSPDRAALSLEPNENSCLVGFVPFDQLLGRCRAIVHHGGMGTCVRALASGIPQLVIPLCHDQPDNSWRLARLGVAREVLRRKLTVDALAAELQPLLGAPVEAACRRWAAAVSADGDGGEKACLALERMARDA